MLYRHTQHILGWAQMRFDKLWEVVFLFGCLVHGQPKSAISLALFTDSAIALHCLCKKFSKMCQLTFTLASFTHDT